jgi:hypothetical protein
MPAMSRAGPLAPRTETAKELVSALRAIEDVLGGAQTGLAPRELAAIERRLGGRLPPIVRAFHATCGADARLLAPTWAGARVLAASLLRVERGVLVVIDTPAVPRGRPGEECGVARAGTRPTHASGAFVERASPEREWHARVLGIATRLREVATVAAIQSMAHVWTGPIRLRSREAKARLRETLELVGAEAGARTFVDRANGLLASNDHLMDRLTVGASTREALAALAACLSAELEPRRARSRRPAARSTTLAAKSR